MQRFRVDLKTFLGLVMPNQSCHAQCQKVAKYLVDIFMGFLSKKLKTLFIPILLSYYMMISH